MRTVPHCIALEHPIALREFEEAKRRRLIAWFSKLPVPRFSQLLEKPWQQLPRGLYPDRIVMSMFTSATNSRGGRLISAPNADLQLPSTNCLHANDIHAIESTSTRTTDIAIWLNA